MDRPNDFRELLVADLALVLGIAEARDVALALQRFWERREQDGVCLASELARIADLGEAQIGRLEAEVEELLQEVGGDARLALLRRGGIDRTIHEAFSDSDATMSIALTRVGAGARTPLRSVDRDHYRDFAPVGEGGMGLVYLALDTELNRTVALKVVRPDAGQGTGEGDSGDPLSLTPPADGTPDAERFAELTARFLQEAWVTGGLEHPGIVPVYELGQTPEGVPYYAMRFVRDARTFETALEEAGSPEERLALLEPFLKVCDTIRYAHAKGVLHRDLKPVNIVIGEFGEVVVLDWGLAKMRDRPDLTRSVWMDRIEEYREAASLRTVASALGTPGYMAPETILGEPEDLDERSDVYSLGAILHQILTGDLPFAFSDLREWLSKLRGFEVSDVADRGDRIPQSLARICERALAHGRETRYADAGELAEAIRSWQRQYAIESEVAALARDAETAFEATEGLAGEDLLRQLGRVTAVTSRIQELQSDHQGAADLLTRIESAQAHAIGEREQLAKSRLLRRVAVIALVLALVLAVVVVLLVDAERQEAERERERANAERDAKHAALAEVTEERNRANQERELKESALQEVTRERDAKAEALTRVLRLADSKKVRDLRAEVDDLWPIHPDMLPAMRLWLEKATALAKNRSLHVDALTALRNQALAYSEEDRTRDHAADIALLAKSGTDLSRLRREIQDLSVDGSAEAKARLDKLEEEAAGLEEEIERLARQVKVRMSWRFPDDTDSWRHDVLQSLVSGIQALTEGPTCSLQRVRARLDLTESLERALVGRDRDLWARTIASIADRSKCPQYGGLRIRPILGLVPLGPDPRSGLHEFAHMGSGSIPTRDPESRDLIQRDDAAIVLILIPRKVFWMGAQRRDRKKNNWDPYHRGMSRVTEQIVPAYLIAKYECTQAQWAAMTEGEWPSTQALGTSHSGQVVTGRNPVESVNWLEAIRCLARHRLELPTEPQWENACRAGTITPWFMGNEMEALSRVGNIADAFLRRNVPDQSYLNLEFTTRVHDGHVVHAPVGSLAPNPFGLHDVYGNVAEWCLEEFLHGAHRVFELDRDYGKRPLRGGSFKDVAERCRSASKWRAAPTLKSEECGIRPSARLPD